MFNFPETSLGYSTFLSSKSYVFNQYNTAVRPYTPQILLVPQASRDQIISQQMSRGAYNMLQHQRSSFEVVKMLLKAIMVLKTTWSIIPHDQCSIVDTACKRTIDLQNHQHTLAGTPVSTQSVYLLESSLYNNTNLQKYEVGIISFCLIHHYLAYNIDYPQKDSNIKLSIRTISEWLPDGRYWIVICICQMQYCSQRNDWNLVKKLLFDNVTFSIVTEDRKWHFNWIDVLDLIYN